MGKRSKKSAPQGPKKREPLATSFQCLFCNHENSVTVKMHKKEGMGELSCRICGQNYTTSIHYLSAAVDVYTDWIDACEAVANKEGEEMTTERSANLGRREPHMPARREPVPQTGGGEEDDLDGFIENDDGDMEAGYTQED